MTSAPSVKEALEPCPFCGGNGKMIHPMSPWTKEGYGPDGSRITCERLDCSGVGKACYGPNQDDEAIAAWNTRATLQPSGERRDAIARIIDPVAFDSCTPGMYGLKNQKELETLTMVGPARRIARDKADQILASSLVQNEAGISQKLFDRAIRALEELTAVVRGECPSLLNDDSGGDGDLSVEIDEIIKEADAIRSARDGGAS